MEKHKSIISKIFCIVVAVALVVLFQSSIIRLTDFLVSYLDVKSTSVNDWSAIVLAVILFGVSYYKNRKSMLVFSTQNLFFLFFLTVYMFFRFDFLLQKGDWDFVSFSFISEIKYLDLFFLSAVLTNFLLPLINLNKEVKKPNADVQKITPFLYDVPNESFDSDTYSRKAYALALVTKLNVTMEQNENSAFTVGITGRWGSGKSSFLNYLKHKLKEDKNIVIEFNPWFNTNPDSIIDNFMDALREELSQYNKNLSKELNVYARLLKQTHENIFTRSIEYVANNQEQSIQKLYDVVSCEIKKIKKPIYILIDDMDRLNRDEILAVLKIIRNTANFPNTCFIATYDRDYVVERIESSDYLSKIFQLEINLPYGEYGLIQNMLIDSIQIVNNENKNLISDFILSFDDLKNLINTPRDAKRFINTFNQNIGFVEEQVNIVDFFLVEILRCKFLEVYNMLFNNTAFLLGSNVNRSESHWIWVGLEGRQNDDVNGLYESLKFDSLQRKVVDNILRQLFPIKGNKYYDSASICNPSMLFRYSAYRLGNTDINNIEMNDILIEESFDKDRIENLINYGRFNSLIEWLKLKKDFNVSLEYFNLLKILLFIYEKYNQDDNQSNIIEIVIAKLRVNGVEINRNLDEDEVGIKVIDLFVEMKLGANTCYNLTKKISEGMKSPVANLSGSYFLKPKHLNLLYVNQFEIMWNESIDIDLCFKWLEFIPSSDVINGKLISLFESNCSYFFFQKLFLIKEESGKVEYLYLNSLMFKIFEDLSRIQSSLNNINDSYSSIATVILEYFSDIKLNKGVNILLIKRQLDDRSRELFEEYLMQIK